ncbi:MAG TPA: PAS domain S-box protein [Aggregatilineales bacterium]|nr:PAS domain S-box protein [Aggregatilineales bacterium]
MKGRLPIRTQLMLLALSVIVPVVGLYVYIKNDEAADDLEYAQNMTLNLAEITAASTEQFLGDSHGLLRQVAQRALDHDIVPEQCDGFLNDFRPLPEAYANFLVVDVTGQLVCSAVPQPPNQPVSYSDRQWFQQVVQDNQFTVGDPVIGRSTGKWSVPLAYPLHNSQGKFVGVLTMPLDLVRYQFIIDDVKLPQNSVLTIVDRTGIIVARAPNGETLVGMNKQGQEIVDRVLAQPTGYIEARGLDGIERIFGFTNIPSIGWHVYVGIPTDAVLANVRSEILRDTVIQLCILLIAVALAYRLAFGISRPIRALAYAAREVKEGRLETRATIAGPLEVAEVAAEFNDMLDVRNRINQALRDNEARLRLIVCQLPVMLWTTDRDLRFTSNSGKGFQALNEETNSLVGQTLSEALNTADMTIPAIQGHLQALEGRSSVYELDWEGHTYESRVEPLRNDQDEIVGCLGVALDVTERNKAVAALHKSEERFRAMIENNSDGILLLTADGIITYASPTSIRRIGYAIGDNLIQFWPDIFRLQDLDAIRQEWAKLLQQPGATVRSEYLVRFKDGSWHWLERVLHNLLSDPGVGAIVGNYRDVTDRKEAEETLRASEELFRALIENSSEGVTLLNADGVVIYRSPGAVRLAAYGLEEAASNIPFDFIHPGDRDRARQQWAELIQQPEKVERQEYRVWHTDGSWHWYEIVFHNLLLNSSVKAVVSNYRDITERKQDEEALRQYTARLEIQRDIDEAILAAQSLEDITVAVLNRVTGLVPSQEAHISLFDFEKQEISMYARVSSGANDFVPGTTIPLDRLGDMGVLLETLRQGQVIITGNLSAAMPDSPLIQNWLTGKHSTVIAAPMREHGNLIGTLSLSTEGPAQFSPAEIEIVRELADSMAVAIMQKRLFEEVRVGRDHLRTLSQRLMKVQEDAGRRLAHELHDQVGTNLTALGMNLNVLRTSLSSRNAARVESRLTDSLKLLDETVDRIRDVMTDLRPAVLDDYGLEAALRWYAGQFSQRTGIEVKVEGAALEPRLSSEAETALFRIVQEALTNVAKHADARHVTITLRRLDRTVTLMIADDGIGINPSEQRKPGQQGGLGLIGMTERSEALGGHTRVESRPYKGTRIIVEVPV